LINDKFWTSSVYCVHHGRDAIDKIGTGDNAVTADHVTVSCAATARGRVAASTGPDLTEVIGRELNLALGHEHVLTATRDREHGRLASHRRLYVRVGLGAQGLDLAALAAHDLGHVLRRGHRHRLGDVLRSGGGGGHCGRVLQTVRDQELVHRRAVRGRVAAPTAVRLAAPRTHRCRELLELQSQAVLNEVRTRRVCHFSLAD
jgi:hypothetical protein